MNTSLMVRPQRFPTAQSTGLVDCVAVLLFLQSGLGLVSVLGTIVMGIIVGAPVLFAGSIGLGLIGVVLPLVFARGLLRFRRRARSWAIAYQALLLIAFVVRLAIGREFAFILSSFLVSGIVPLLLLGLLLSGSARRAFAKTRIPNPVIALPAPAPAPTGEVAA